MLGIRSTILVSAGGRRSLTNPIYIGKVRHHDQLFDGLHEPLIDPTMFRRVQELMMSEAFAAQLLGCCSPL
jgi:hypothetical protein